MNARITKELRPLRLPWCVAALGAAGYLLGPGGAWQFPDPVGDLAAGLAGMAFVVGCLVLAALPLGSELQERTLVLLFTQPAERMRLWREKLAAALLAVVALGLIHGLASGVAGRSRWPELWPCVAFMAAAICSVGYWTVATRSVIVGIVCAVSAPVSIAASAHLVLYYVLGIDVTLSERATLLLGLALSVAYCGFFLWLGRRQIARLELKDGPASRAAQIPEALVPRQLARQFRSQASGAVANLIRKELCLQRPVFLVCATFAAGWVLTWLTMLVRPAWQGECLGVLNGLTGAQVVLMLILTGCVSLGDDKVLGTWAWHLTLPISARRQWAIKLGVAAATALATTVLLPILLAALTLFKAPVGLIALPPGDIPTLAMPATLVFLLSFWSASLTGNAVRAALLCMGALICLPISVLFGSELVGSLLGLFSVLQTGLIARVLARFQLPPDYFINHWEIVTGNAVVLGLIAVCVGLWQSLALFRRAQSRTSVKVRYALVLATLVVVGALWCSELARSIQRPGRRFDSEMGRALAVVPRAREIVQSGQTGTLTAPELERTGELSALTLAWLRDAQIVLTPRPAVPKRGASPAPARLDVAITFPKGAQYFFSPSEAQPLLTPPAVKTAPE
jgi:hypothetical protein